MRWKLVLLSAFYITAVAITVYLPAEEISLPEEISTPAEGTSVFSEPGEVNEEDAPSEEYEGDAEDLEGQGMLPQPAEETESSSIFASSKVNQSGDEVIEWNPDWPYASYSQIHTGTAMLYRPENGNGVTVCVNAGHGTAGGWNYQTQCHPDGSPKVTGGSTAAGSVYAAAVSSGTVMQDGTEEGAVNLQLAKILKEKLLALGFNVLMIRETDDVQLDNIARTVIANQNADCHLAIHYDSSASDKGFYYISVPSVDSYRSMEPVASHWQQHNALGDAVLSGIIDCGNHICGSGSMELDLTQTSYSTIPSIDVECGDTASDWSPAAQEKIAEGIAAGVSRYFGG